MPDRRFTLAASPTLVFPGSQIDNARLYHDDIVVEADDQGIRVIIPESVDPETCEDAAFYLGDTLGFIEETA